ncbi:MAG: hypothetical protein DI606_17425 [Sphingobium sp.]|nr:MAG: hypothetical protein DI606_17425 [Sphingobium sp.]
MEHRLHKKNMALLAALQGVLAPVALSIPAVAAAQQVASREDSPISVPPGDLAETLRRIGEASGHSVTYDPDAVKGMMSPGVKKAHSLRAAILEAVRGHDLAIRVEDDGSFVIFQPIAAGPSDIIVTAQRDEAETNYRVNKTTTSDRSGGTLRSLPQNTAVVSDKLMRDQQAQSVTEALRNVAGVASFANNGTGLTSATVRGFEVTPLRNGTGPTASGGNPSAGIEPTANIERIEVLKGPAAILAGQSNIGGTINVVTKKPTADPLLVLSGEYQSRDSFKGTIDASNALVPSKVLSARIVAEVQGADRSYGGSIGRKEKFLSPSLRYKKSGSDFTIGLTTSEQREAIPFWTIINTVPDSATPVGGLISRDRYVVGRKSASISANSTRLYGDFTQAVTPWLDLVARGEHYTQTVDQIPINVIDTLDYGKLLAFNSHALDKTRGDSVDGYGRFQFSTFGIKHTLVTGYNYTRTNIRHFDAPSTMVEVDFLDPTATIAEPEPVLPNPSYIIGFRENAVYAQELLEYGPVHLSLGIRRTWFVSTAFLDGFGDTEPAKAVSTVPAFGLVVDLSPSVSVFGNYSKGYIPTTEVSFTGEKLPDIRSTNKEIGVKADLFDKRASLVVSLFDTRQNNLLIPDPAHPGYAISIIGGRRARGIDGTLTGQLLRGLNANLTYSYTKYDYANASAAAAAGSVYIPGQPAHKYNAFLSYDPQNAFVGGAIGLSGYSRTYAQVGLPGYRIPGGSQVDGNVYFKKGGARLNIGVKNLLDKRLYQATSNPLFVPIADGRTITATLSYRFF